MTFSAGAVLRRAGDAGLRCPNAVWLVALGAALRIVTLASPVIAGTAASPATPAIEASPAESASPKAPVDKSEWESGWHVVRPGDTLEGLADRYLGSAEHWRELHVLNPFVRDPDLLFPGQRLRIFLERPTAKLSAQLMAVARDVRELPTPVPWRPAAAGDVLLERDALRTAESSSARLRFDDGATVTLSEDSLVFIRRESQANSPLTSLPTKEIEIEVGQADVESAAAAEDRGIEGSAGRGAGRGAGAIEVVVAGARSRVTTEGGQPLSTRSRRTAGATAQFMVFAGKSTVSAAGSSVDVPAGSGTSVAAKAKPGPVETLLPAPTGLRPGDQEELEQGSPVLSWNPVPGADHYTVEVCRDAACGSLLDRVPDVGQSPLRLPTASDALAGTLFWRVTAVASSGLDGFPSATIRFSGVDAATPPAPALALKSSTGETIAASAASGCFAAAPGFVVRAVDRNGAALPWRLLLDGRERALEELRTLPLDGRHEAAARVTDARGRTADSPAIPFTVDRSAPWVDLVATSARSAETSPENPAATPDSKPQHRWFRRKAVEPAPTPACDSGLEVRDAAGVWSTVPCSASAAPAPAVMALDPARPTVAIRTTGSAVTVGGMRAAAQETLSLNAWDVGCGGGELALRIAPSPYRSGQMLLEVEVVDAAGNRRTQGWHLAKS